MSTHTNIGGNDPAWPYLRARLNEKDIQLENSADYMAVLKAMHDYADHFALSRSQADPSVLVEALEEITKPIEFMRKRLQKGEQLNGGYAIQLSRDSEYLKQIASKALTTYKESKPSPSITREQAEKIWDAGSASAYKCKEVFGDSGWGEGEHNAEKEEYLKQFS